MSALGGKRTLAASRCKSLQVRSWLDFTPPIAHLKDYAALGARNGLGLLMPVDP
jgi:hypothetical protein